MVLSERDKKLLIFLGVVVLAVAAYFFLYDPMLKKQKVLESEISALNGSYQVLLEKESDMEKYQTELKAVKYRNQQIEAILPPDLRQEYIIRTLAELEDKAGIKFGSLSFSKTAPVNTTQQTGQNGNSQASQEQTAAAADTATQTGEKQLQGCYGIMETVKTTYKASYNHLKNFMDIISNFENRICISLIDFNGDAAGNMSGNIEFDFYGLRDESRKLPEWTWQVDAGREDPFKAFQGYVERKQTGAGASESGNADQTGGDGALKQKVSYDFILSANPFTADIPSLILGYAKDKTGAAVVYADSREKENAEVKIYQSNGAYYYTLKTDSMEFPSKDKKETAVLTAANEVINFHIIGTARVDQNDRSEVQLSVINSTDVPLKIRIDEEDRDKPRVKLVKQEGKVAVEK